MRRRLSVIALFALPACQGVVKVPTELVQYPDVELSTDMLEFGELDLGDSSARNFVVRNRGDLALGIESIAIREEGYESHFSISWSPNDISCPEGSGGGNGAEEDGALVDTASSGGGDDGGGSDGGGGGAVVTQGDVLLLEPDCELPIRVDYSPAETGVMWGSIEIVTVSEDVELDEDNQPLEDPTFWQDPDRYRHVVMMNGSAIQGVGNIVVRSPTVDMGHHYPGESEVRYVYVHNVGDGELVVNEPTLDPTCSEAYTLNTAYMPDRPLLPGEASLFEIWFQPVDTSAAFCSVEVTSDDEDSPSITVQAKGNSGYDPENVAPEVSIRWPDVGYQHRSPEPLRIEVNVFDRNQPANTLICKVRSLVDEARLADCTPDSDSGHVFVEIPIELLSPGTDTLSVIVTDQAEFLSEASTTVLWRGLYPPSDDDGDGWGDDPADGQLYVDCDDERRDVYPGAAELPDGIDNDCDGAIDEDSLGGDDDGDSVSELQGDCNDRDPDTYPGAMEQPDQKDNDCDGFVDEGTSLVDDDGDGFSELDLDCDDSDPNVNPAAIEYCNGVDDNCNFINDQAEPDGCIELENAPVIVGGIVASEYAIGAGESTTLSVFAFDPDGDDLLYTWNVDSKLANEYGGLGGLDTTTAPTVTFTAPPYPEGMEEGEWPGAIFSVQVSVTDVDGKAAIAQTEEITVYPEEVQTEYELVLANEATEEGGGCSKSGDSETSEAWLLAPFAGFLGLFAAARRRRED
jgi:hypothetical protein